MLKDSIDELEVAIKQANIVMLPGVVWKGDESAVLVNTQY